MQAYCDRLDRQILPGLGELRMRELSVGIVDRHLRLVATDHGVATAKMTRSVLSEVCTLALATMRSTATPSGTSAPSPGRPRGRRGR